MKNLGILLPKQGIHWVLFACDITVAHLTMRNCNILGVAYATECPSMLFVFYKGLPSFRWALTPLCKYIFHFYRIRMHTWDWFMSSGTWQKCSTEVLENLLDSLSSNSSPFCLWWLRLGQNSEVWDDRQVLWKAEGQHRSIGVPWVFEKF